MKWKDTLNIKSAIIVNALNRQRVRNSLEGLYADVAVDSFLDEQEPGQNLLCENNLKQDRYAEELDKLYDLKDIAQKPEDIKNIEFLIENIENTYNECFIHFEFENSNLADPIEQGFEFVKNCEVFSEKEIDSVSMEQFLKAGKYITSNMIELDEQGAFYQCGTLEENIDDMLKFLNISKEQSFIKSKISFTDENVDIHNSKTQERKSADKERKLSYKEQFQERLNQKPQMTLIK